MSRRAPSSDQNSGSAARLRRSLVQELRARDVIRSDSVAAAFSTVPREQFIPGVLEDRGLAAVYSDEVFVTKRDARGLPLSSSSQPAMMAEMLELLDLRPGQRVLEIGAGTGYNAALLANIVGPAGRVDSIDIDPETARRARRALREGGFRVAVSVGDGRAGLARRAPYDRIIVTASTAEIPSAWLQQLAEHGRLEPVVQLDRDRDAVQLIPVFERRGDTLHSLDMTWGGFMPLHDGDGGWVAPRASLSAARARSGRHTAFVSFSGQGLGRLSDLAARRLLVAALAEAERPRAGGLTPLGRGHTPLLLIYLLTRIPERRRIWIRKAEQHGIGIIDASRQTAAIVSVRSTWLTGAGPPRNRARWQLHKYGEGDEACLELERMLEDWRELQAPRPPELGIESRRVGATLRLRFAWKARSATDASR
jgi:protein-L-isoaspartate(D-aspartate) O-methyltransferase